NEGVGDTVRPLDVQALGALALDAADQTTAARAVLTQVDSAFLASNRSITTSSAAATYNMTYSAKGPFIGYRPYAGSDTPDVLWMEGTREVALARDAAGLDTKALDSSFKDWNKIASGGVLGADRTASSPLNEYHVWPTSASASWTLLAFKTLSPLFGSTLN